MQAVILAAGDGGRLVPMTFFQPKPLIKVCGKPMLDYTVEALERAGVRDILIVTGYKAWRISEYVRGEAPYRARIVLAHNPEYEKGNALSLLAGQKYIRKCPFILAMADHLFSPELIMEALRQSNSTGNFLAVDYDPGPWIVEEATKVLVDEKGEIRAAGKDLKQFNAVDTGLFILTEEIFTAIKQVLAEKGDCELSDALNYLIEAGSGLKACNVSGCFWMDVDTPEDLRRAEIRLSREVQNARRVRFPIFEPEILKATGSPSRSNTTYPKFRKLLELSRRDWLRTRFPEGAERPGRDPGPGGLGGGWG